MWHCSKAENNVFLIRIVNDSVKCLDFPEPRIGMCCSTALYQHQGQGHHTFFYQCHDKMYKFHYQLKVQNVTPLCKYVFKRLESVVTFTCSNPEKSAIVLKVMAPLIWSPVTTTSTTPMIPCLFCLTNISKLQLRFWKKHHFVSVTQGCTRWPSHTLTPSSHSKVGYLLIQFGVCVADLTV